MDLKADLDEVTKGINRIHPATDRDIVPYKLTVLQY
jgi:hypothetical protein